MTDFQALCAELADCLEKANWPLRHKILFEICLADARAALAQPEPQRPTNEDLLETAAQAVRYEHVPTDETCLSLARAVLQRWGGPSIKPVPVAERLPGPEDCLGRPWEGTDAGFCWWFYPGLDGWRLMVATIWENGDYQNWTPPGTTHWLPHYALPVPQQEGAND